MRDGVEEEGWQWIKGCQREEKKNSQNATYWEAVPAFAVLSWAQ